MKLDDLRIGVRNGDGIVARRTGALLVVPFDGMEDQSAVDRLLASWAVGGRLDELCDAGVASFAVVAELGDTLGVFAAGDAGVSIAGGDPVLRLGGRDVDGWSVRVPSGFRSLDVGVEGAAPDARLDLRDGVGAGVGVVLTAPAAVPMAPAEPAAVAPPAPVAMSAPEPSAVAPPAAVAMPAPEPGVPEVWGIRCKKGHFNDPEARYCGICGIHMVQDKSPRVKGPRPLLGYLVLDDGMSFKLDTDYVMGSDPHGHEAVASGIARPLVVTAEGGVVSPVHARVVLRDWDVFVSDCGSVYGTHVWSPGAPDWQRLAPEQEVKLGAGSQVMLAQRGFMFQPVNKR